MLSNENVQAPKGVRKLWISVELIKMIEEKKLYGSSLKTRNISTLVSFKKIRNRETAELRKAKTTYYQKLFHEAEGSRPDRVWKIINDALGTRSVPNDKFEMIVSGQALNTALDEHFNAHYINAISSTLSASVSFYRVQCDIPDTAFVQPTDFSEVQHTFGSLKIAKVSMLTIYKYARETCPRRHLSLSSSYL